MKFFILTFFSLLISTQVFSAEVSKNPVTEKIKKGNELYEQQDYASASREYAAAQIDDPENSVVNFNQGDAFYKQKKYDKAIAAYKKALEYPTKETEVKALYNIGNCLVQQGKLRPALEMYKRALKLDRKDKDIKYNIEYVQLKLKELEKKKKKKKEDPLNKLLKELEKLIGLQAQNNVQTKQLVSEQTSGITNQQAFISAREFVFTNQQNYVQKTIEIREGFKDLRTNLPPAKLYGTQQPQMGKPNMPVGQPQPVVQQPQQPDKSALELANIFQALNDAARELNNSNATISQVIKSVGEKQSLLEQIKQSALSKTNKDFSGRGSNLLKKIKDMLSNPVHTNQSEQKKIGKEFNELMIDIQKELAGKMPMQMPGGTKKTLAQKIDNAVKYLAVAREHLDTSAKSLESKLSAAPSDQKIGLEYLIKARKEFDDKNKKGGKQNQKQKQNKKNNKGKNKQDKKDKQKNKQNKKQDKKQDKKQNKQQNKNKQQKQQKKDQNKQKQKKPELNKQQVKQMLKNFKEDQRNKRKARMQKMRASGYVPVDKDW